MAIPAFRAAGTQVATANSVANPTNLSPTKNAATVNGDVMILVTASRSRTATVGTPSGWNLVSGFPKASGTASGGTIYIFTRVADGTSLDAPTVTWTGLTTGTTGDSATARILSYQNLTETADGTPPAANDAANTTSITIPAHTTSLAQSMVIGVAIRIHDTAHTFTVATFTERFDGHTTSGTGHGTVVAEKLNASAGSSGTAAVTPSNTTSVRTLAVSFGLKAAATVVAVNQVTETSTAQAITRNKASSVAQATETSTAQAVSSSKTLSVAQVTEENSAQAITRVKSASISQVTETSEAQAFTVVQGSPAQTIAVGQATETSAAQPLTSAKAKAVGQATEVSEAQALASVKTKPIAQATEVSEAQALTSAKAKAVGQATETSAAQPMTSAKVKAVGQVLEGDFALSISPRKTLPIGQVQESSAAAAIGRLKVFSLAQATESSSALSFSAAKRKSLGQAEEFSFAQGIGLAGGHVVLGLGQAQEFSTANQIAAIQTFPVSESQVPTGGQPRGRRRNTLRGLNGVSYLATQNAPEPIAANVEEDEAVLISILI